MRASRSSSSRRSQRATTCLGSACGTGALEPSDGKSTSSKVIVNIRTHVRIEPGVCSAKAHSQDCQFRESYRFRYLRELSFAPRACAGSNPREPALVRSRSTLACRTLIGERLPQPPDQPPGWVSDGEVEALASGCRTVLVQADPAKGVAGTHGRGAHVAASRPAQIMEASWKPRAPRSHRQIVRSRTGGSVIAGLSGMRS